MAVEVRDVDAGLWLWRPPHPDWDVRGESSMSAARAPACVDRVEDGHMLIRRPEKGGGTRMEKPIKAAEHRAIDYAQGVG
jgi:hypothetical protein